MRIVNVVANQG